MESKIHTISYQCGSSSLNTSNNATHALQEAGHDIIEREATVLYEFVKPSA